MSEAQSHKVIGVVPCAPINRVLSYRFPERWASSTLVGRRVLIPIRNRWVTGIVVDDSGVREAAPELKSVTAVLDAAPLFPSDLLQALLWASEYYCVGVGALFSVALPPGLQLKELPKLSMPKAMKDRLKKTQGRALDEILESLGEAASAEVKELLEKLFVSPLSLDQSPAVPLETLRMLATRRFVRITGGGSEVNSRPVIVPIEPSPLTLSAEQDRALSAIRSEWRETAARPVLLHGVTGSGKTELYLRLAAETVQRGDDVIMMVPEISLTPQLARRFETRLGARVILLHSGLTERTRAEAFLRCAREPGIVVLGARSAVFSPVQKLGLLIVDEEHDPSYKQADGVLYNAKHLALVRARHRSARVLMGSATPSLESYRHAERGRYLKLELFTRPTPQPLPAVQVVDLTSVPNADYREPTVLSPELRAEMRAALSRREQVILFINRRGFSTLVLCSRCRTSVRCRNCEVHLTYHNDWNRLVCHHCGYSVPLNSRCPEECGGRLELMGIGTKRIVEVVKREFPEARLARLDRDFADRRLAAETLIERFEKGEADILIGTQMITKGLDFPNVSVVGIIAADLSLQIPDFRSSERTFQLLSQVAGRAGRGTAPGRVIIQTYQPTHISIEAARTHDYRAFFESEMEHRRKAGFPPFGNLIQITLNGTDRDQLLQTGHRLREALVPIAREASASILGPAPAPIERIRQKYRIQLLVHAPRSGFTQLNRKLFDAMGSIERSRSMSIQWDVDPMQFV